MSYLKKISRKSEKETRIHPISTRITDSEYNAFYSLCNETGYSVSEAIRLLIQKEIQDVNEMNIEDTQEHTKENTKRIHKSPPVVNNKNTDRIQNGNTKRFTATQWKVNDLLPCPICKSWINHKNYSRHVRTSHDKTTRELLTEYKEKADQMVTQMKNTL